MATSPYYKQNRLKQLRAFCHAARLGSISRAAEQLFLSQPSVSLQIQALERELATELFERRGPSIRLTTQGEALLELAQPLVQGIDNIAETFSSELGEINSGEINIAAGESTILYLLPEHIKRFATAYPGVRIKLHNVTGRDGMAMLRADEADFAVGSMLDVPEDVNYRPIFDFKTVLITPLEHPLAGKRPSRIKLEDISPFGLILPPRHLATWRIVEMIFRQHDVNYTVNLEAGGWEVIKKYVELSLGISIVTDICLTGKEKIKRISLERFFPDRSYGVVLRKRKYLSPPARQFLEMMAPGFSGGLDSTVNG
ncbi:MAG: LysR family transcriptional regulator [Acidiferrobacteraceae bacterium]|jgi:DNA-binding transcriptional LysR family regulator|nr:LysR family transcriptional regulator [Acidiferrobacteraceae bacterium]MDP7564236.1 LysR family transcriptional regulator [Arenicellales bacterium]